MLRIPCIFFSLLLLLCFAACDPDPEEQIIVPKPRMYPRIDFPAHTYKVFDSLCPYSFETPQYSVVLPDEGEYTEPCWVNVFYPRFGAVLHVSYKTVQGNLNQFMKDCDNFAKKHTVKANGLEENVIFRDTARVFGLLYDIKGNAASNLQFFVTDSVRHFLRGSLYFNVAPNIDSLQPVIDFLREDIVQLVKTLKWKNAVSISSEVNPMKEKKTSSAKIP